MAEINRESDDAAVIDAIHRMEGDTTADEENVKVEEQEEIEKERIEEDGDEESRPLIPPRSISPTPSSMSRRRRHYRRQWIAFAFTVLFIFLSIALLVFYFTLPSIIKSKIFGGSGRDKLNKGQLRAQSVSLSNVTEQSFDLESRVLIDMDGSPLGSLVDFRNGRIEWKGSLIAGFSLHQPFYVPRSQPKLSFMVSVHVVIADGGRFGEMVAALLTEDIVDVTVRADMWLKPDYFPPLPSTNIALSVPVEGAPTLLKRIDGGMEDIAFDIVDGRHDRLDIIASAALPMNVKVPQSLNIGLNVRTIDDRHQIAVMQSTGTDGERVYGRAMVPPMSDPIRRAIDGKMDQVLLKGSSESTHPLLRDIIPHVRLAVPLPPDRLDLQLIKEIVILDLMGRTTTIAANPFNVPLHLHKIDQMDIYFKEKMIGQILDAGMNCTVPPKTEAMAVRKNARDADRIRFTGGIGQTLKLVKEIAANGFIEVRVKGHVTVSLGGYRADHIPFTQDKLIVSTKQTTRFPDITKKANVD